MSSLGTDAKKAVFSDASVIRNPPVNHLRREYGGPVDGRVYLAQAKGQGSKFLIDSAHKLGTSESLAQATAKRQCPYCGASISRSLAQCPKCRETVPEIHQPQATRVSSIRGKDRRVRRGLLFMLLAAVVHYFAGGYSAMNLPYPINPVVTVYLSPLLFLSGLGLMLYGFFSRRRI